MITLNGQPVTSLRFNLSGIGCSWAEVSISFPGDTDPVPTDPGAAILQIEDRSFVCTRISGGVSDGRGSYCLVGGRGGWRNSVTRLGYSSPRAQQILTDVALLAGEQIVFDSDLPQLGEHYARLPGLASQVINQLAPQNWYVDDAGVTHVGQRTSSPLLDRQLTKLREDLSSRLVEYAIVDSVAGISPGVIVPGMGPATDVEFRFAGEALTCTIYCSESTKEKGTLAAMRAIFDALDPLRRYRNPYEYRVVSQMGDRFALQAVRSGHGMPDLTNVPYRPGLGGGRSTVMMGSTCVVQFLDADPSRPFISNFGAAGAPGSVAIEISLHTLAGAATLNSAGILSSPTDVTAGPLSTSLVSHTHIAGGLLYGSPPVPPVVALPVTGVTGGPL